MADQVYSILDPANYNTRLVEQFHFHNDFFSFAVAAGVFGIICFALFITAPMVGAYYSERDSLYSLRLEIILLLCTLYFISGLTDMVIGYDLPTAMFALISAIILGAFRDNS
jgi:O-antigen ligase